ncbi:unnamed protein product, partial [Linum tenue]
EDEHHRRSVHDNVQTQKTAHLHAGRSLRLTRRIDVRRVLVVDEHRHQRAVHPRVELHQRGRRTPAAGSPPPPRLPPAEQAGGNNRNLRRSLPSPIEAVQRAERRLGEGIQPAAALLQGSVPSDARIQGEGGPRIRRIRESVQRNPAQIKDRSRREENLSRFAARDEGIRRGDRQHGEAAPPESGTFARLLPAKGRAASGLRLHAQRQPGYLPVQRREADSRLDFTVPNRPKS